MKHRASLVLFILPPMMGLIAISVLLFSAEGGRATQAPKMGLDMVTIGNSYDAGSNSMTVGTIDNCLATDAPGNNDRHNHAVDLVVQDVEDLVGWQARLNYDGGKMRPASVNFTPYTDASTGQNISFTNLPRDPSTGSHSAIASPSDIPPPAAGPQTALIAAAYLGEQSAASSPDTPPKVPPDDSSYAAPSGGVVATLNLQVMPGQAGQLLTMDLDDANPNSPGSKIVVFDTTGTKDIFLEESSLLDGFHAEGIPCVPPGGAGGGGPGGGTSPPNGAPGAVSSSPPPGAPGGSAGSSATSSPTGATTPALTSSPVGQSMRGPGSEGGGGTSIWIYLVAAAIPLAALAAFVAWRFRSSLPWLKR